MFYIPAIVISFLNGFDLLGLALFLLAPLHMFLMMSLALFALLKTRCSECGGRYFSILFPVWPFENRCASCGTVDA